MGLKIYGKVKEKESQNSIPNLVVEAFDGLYWGQTFYSYSSGLDKQGLLMPSEISVKSNLYI